MNVTTIGITVGIYNAALTIMDNGASIVVIEPYVRWTGDTGSLAYRTTTYTKPRQKQLIRKFAEAGELYLDQGDADQGATWGDINYY